MTFSSTAADPTSGGHDNSRTIGFQVNDGVQASNSLSETVALQTLHHHRGKSAVLVQTSAETVATSGASNGSAAHTVAAGLGPEQKSGGDLLGHGHSDFLIAARDVAVGGTVNGQAASMALAALGPDWKFVGDAAFLVAGKDGFLIEGASGAVVNGHARNGVAFHAPLAPQSGVRRRRRLPRRGPRSVPGRARRGRR